MNKKWLAIAAAAYTAIFFVLTGNSALIKGIKAQFLTVDGIRFSKNYVLTKYMTTGTLQVAFIFIAIGVISAFYFMNKEEQFRIRLNSKEDRVKYFKESMIVLIIPAVVGIILNFLIRSGMFIASQEILSLELDIAYFSVVSTYLYVLAIVFAGIPVSFLFQVGVKSKFIGAIMPVLMAESVIMVVGVTNLFTTGAFESISNKVSVPILYLANTFAYNYRVEMLGSKVFGITVLGLVAFACVCMAVTCRLLITYDEKALNLSYRFTWLRRLMILAVVPLFTIYILLAIFCSYSMFVHESIALDRAFQLTNLISVILVPLLCVGAEIWYMKSNNLTANKKVRKSIKKVDEDIENSKVQSDVQTVQDELLESKGIVKETVLVECDEEKLEHEIEQEKHISSNEIFVEIDEDPNTSLEALRREVNKVLENIDDSEVSVNNDEEVDASQEVQAEITTEEDDFFTINRD